MNNEKTNSLTEQIQATANLLAKLETERSDFQPRMTAAVGAGDSDAMINLRRRQAEIPMQIQGVEIQLAQMLLESDSARLPLLQAKLSKLADPIAEAVLKRDAAVLELNLLQDEYYTARENVRDLNRQLGERRRELERLIYMANPAREIGGTRLRNLNAT